MIGKTTTIKTIENEDFKFKLGKGEVEVCVSDLFPNNLNLSKELLEVKEQLLKCERENSFGILWSHKYKQGAYLGDIDGFLTVEQIDLLDEYLAKILV